MSMIVSPAVSATRRSTKPRFVHLVTAIFLLFSVAAIAQSDVGTIVGFAKDQSGAVVPNATVTSAPRSGWRSQFTHSCESMVGVVFGMQHTEVNPPAAAAAVPEAIVSLYVCPGSRKWTCRSMKPGATSLS